MNLYRTFQFKLPDNEGDAIIERNTELDIDIIWLSLTLKRVYYTLLEKLIGIYHY